MLYNRKVYLGLAALFASVAPATMVHAQQASAPDTVGEIVVTAQRREQRLSDVPLSVQAQTGEALRKAGINDSRAIEQISPAVNFTSSYNNTTTSVVIRGAASIANEGGIQPSVGVVIDNVPVARQGEFIQDLADIDRIEVLSGPQGTLFGKNSTAGVINIISNRPKDTYEAAFEASATTDQEYVGKVMANLPLGEGVAARINGYARRIEPLLNNIGPAGDQMGLKAYGGQAKVLFDFAGGANLLLSTFYNHNRSTMGPNVVVTPISSPLGDFQRQVFGPIGRGVTTINQDTESYNKARSYGFVAELNWDLSDDLRLVSISGYRNYRNLTETDIDGGPIGANVGRGLSPNPLGYPIEYLALGDPHLPEANHYFSQEVRLNYTAPKLDVVGGVFYQNYDETRQLLLPFLLDGAFATGNPALAGTRFITNDTLNSAIRDNTFAVFGDATYEVAPTVKVFGGLRYTTEKLGLDYLHNTYFNPVAGFVNLVTGVNTAPPVATLQFTTARKDDDISGRIGVQWQPASGRNYYASYNRGYKGPAANQGRAVTGAATALLDPEIAKAFEIGAKQRFFDGRFAINAAVYRQTIENIQQTAVLPNSVTADLINAGSLKIKGFELNSQIRPPLQGLSIDAGLVYNDAYYGGKNASGQPPRFSCGPSMTPGVGRCQADGTQSLVGQQAIGSPKWKFVGAVNYDQDLANDLLLSWRLAYTWRSSIQYQLHEDPLTRERSAGLLDASVGIGPTDGRWQVTLFGKNLTDHFYYANLNTADFFIGRQFANLPRDFRRYGGIRFNYKM